LQQRGDDVVTHRVAECVNGLVHEEWNRRDADLEPELDAAADGARLDGQDDGGEKRVRLPAESLVGVSTTGGPLDTDRRRFVEVDVDPEVGRDGLLDDFPFEVRDPPALGTARCGSGA
jgi:hypothetical protein